jgi:uncharacterized repeat protein (TIGR03806 family)
MPLHHRSTSPKLAAIVAIVFAVWAPRHTPAGEPPYGLEKRIPWKSSRLVGSPEPPLPFTVARAFTKQEWKSPIYIAREPSLDALWIVQSNNKPDQGSLIIRIKDDPDSGVRETVLEIPKQLVYSVCFDPEYRNNGFVYVFTNGPRDAPERMNRVSRYAVAQQPLRVDPKSETLLIEWKSAGHDGGDMTFGLDGMFYITTGDGTSDSDGWDSGQTLNDLLGSVLRIDAHPKNGKQPYGIPRDNPFVSTPGARPEIWAYGLRNPWRMCTDAKTGHIWVGNNGQDLWETAHLLRRGANYGWSVYEGSHPFYLERKRGPTPLVLPTIEHSHAEFRSLTGGVVYHGKLFPELEGAYIYGDNSSGRIWGMEHDGERVIWHRELADTILQISAFQVDRRGELFVADYAGGINRLVRAPKETTSAPFPTLLSQTGLFTSTSPYRLNPSLVPYSVNAPGWADGAEAERFIAVPGDAKVAFSSSSPWTFPDGTALVQTLSLDCRVGSAARRFRVETRVLLRQQGEWAGYSYRWNSEQTDASLVAKSGEDTEIDLGRSTGSPAAQSCKWRFPSRAECMTCHSRAANFVLGVTGSQLNRDHDYGGVRDNQLRALDHIGFFNGALPKAPKDLERLADPRDSSADVELRARTYLHVNCSVCHVEAGGGNSRMQLALSTPRDKMELLKARPQHDTFGITSAMLVAPGAPERSVLLHRLSRRGRGQMPPLVTNHVDEAAVKLFREWIAELKSDQVFVRDWRMEDFVPSLDQVSIGRSIESGRKAFRDTGCRECHRAEGQGGSVGPDLTGIGRRLRPPEILESILLPSKVVAPEYATVLVETAGGEVLSGRIEREDDQVLVLRPPSKDQSVTIRKNEIIARKRSDLSNMPPGIVNVLRKEQVLDLLAYLIDNQGPREPLRP